MRAILRDLSPINEKVQNILDVSLCYHCLSREIEEKNPIYIPNFKLHIIVFDYILLYIITDREHPNWKVSWRENTKDVV